MIPHYAVIANVLQMAAYHKVNEDYTTWDKRRFRPGDVCAAGKFKLLCIESFIRFKLALQFFHSIVSNFCFIDWEAVFDMLLKIYMVW